eukprot:scaffold254192_cov28-Prasinocladus_malaysianus.AAC.2
MGCPAAHSMRQRSRSRVGQHISARNASTVADQPQSTCLLAGRLDVTTTARCRRMKIRPLACFGGSRQPHMFL